MREIIRLCGLIFMVGALLLLWTGYSAGDALVMALVGFGLSRWLVE